MFRYVRFESLYSCPNRVIWVTFSELSLQKYWSFFTNITNTAVLLPHRCKAHAQVVVPTIAFHSVLQFKRQNLEKTTDIQNAINPLECKLYQKSSTFQSFDNQEKLVLLTDPRVNRLIVAEKKIKKTKEK